MVSKPKTPKSKDALLTALGFPDTGPYKALGFQATLDHVLQNLEVSPAMLADAMGRSQPAVKLLCTQIQRRDDADIARLFGEALLPLKQKAVANGSINPANGVSHKVLEAIRHTTVAAFFDYSGLTYEGQEKRTASDHFRAIAGVNHILHRQLGEDEGVAPPSMSGRVADMDMLASRSQEPVWARRMGAQLREKLIELGDNVKLPECYRFDPSKTPASRPDLWKHDRRSSGNNRVSER